jgi:hypothetical protein
MPDPTKTGFIPKWLRDEPLGEAEPFFQAGTVPDPDPRVDTRLVPKHHGYTIHARTLSRVIDLKQDLVYHAARDVKDGVNPNFTDLMGLPKSLRDSAALEIAPAEVGSYIIPATLPSRAGDIDAQAVLDRFVALLSVVQAPDRAQGVSIGAIQVCRELARVLDRDVETIEVTAYDSLHQPKPPVTFTPHTAHQLDRLLDRRRTTTQEVERVTGRLEALDIGKNEFHLKLPGVRRRVKGHAAFFATSSLRDYLGGSITLEGVVVRDGRSVTMTAFHVVDGGE